MNPAIPFPQATPPAGKVLEEPLRTKAIAVRLQFEVWDRELVIGQLQARVATLEREALRRTLEPLERQLLDALEAPIGATFNWDTLSYTPAEAGDERR